MSFKRVDRSIFGVSLGLIVLVSLPLALYPKEGEAFVKSVFAYIGNTFGSLYLLGGLATVLFLTWISFSRYGNIRLGSGTPEFSAFSWTSMVFSAGIGTGVLYWGTVEWAYHIDAPPMGLVPRSNQAIEMASAYGIFHWGITGWAFFALATLPIAYCYYIRKRYVYRISEACRGLLGDSVDGPLGKAIDIFFVLGLLAAAGTSLGLGTPLIGACVHYLFGFERGIGLNIAIISIVTGLFAWSVCYRLDRGIKKSSDWSVILALLLLAYVFVVGPTRFMMDNSVTSLGLVMQEFFHMSTWTDPVGRSGFPQSWTVFYWAWWLVLAPALGLFVTRISRGRTVRQVVLGMLFYGSSGCALFYMILGNYALNLELTGALNVTALIKQVGAEMAIVQIVGTLPGGKWVVAAFAIVAIIFLATLFNSKSYILASTTIDRLAEGEEPPRSQRLIWAVALSLLPIALMVVGGLESLQIAATVGALPILLILLVMTLSLLRQLAADEARLKQFGYASIGLGDEDVVLEKREASAVDEKRQLESV
ncbi:BCCT family transporter [Pseudomonas putida]